MYLFRDFVNVADVITNYSKAGIPLETMWTDIDYMFKRWIFTNDPDYFPTDRMREIVDYLHRHNQQYGTVLSLLHSYDLANEIYSSYDGPCCRISTGPELWHI